MDIKEKYNDFRDLLSRNQIEIASLFNPEAYSCTCLQRDKFYNLYTFRSQFITNPFVKHNLLKVLADVSVLGYESLFLNGYFHEGIFYLIITDCNFEKLIGIVCFNSGGSVTDVAL